MQFSGPFGHARWIQGSDVSAAESLDGIRNCCWNTRRATYRASPSLWHPSQAQRAISTAASQNPAINCLFSLTISLPEVASSLSGTLLWLSKIVCLHKALSLHNGEGTLRVSNSCSWEHLSKYCWGKKMWKGMQSLFLLSDIWHITCDFHFLFIYGDNSPVILFWISSSCFGALFKVHQP